LSDTQVSTFVYDALDTIVQWGQRPEPHPFGRLTLKGERRMSRAGGLRATGVLVAAVMLAMIFVVVVAGAEPADAAFPGKNGKIAYSKFNVRQDFPAILTINPDGSEPARLGPGYAPSWSADGAKVVFEKFSGDGEEEFNSDIYVMNADGSGVEQVTSGAAYDHSPAFFPSGDKIAFIRDSRRHGTDIFTINLDGTGRTNLTDSPTFFEESLAVSPEISPGEVKIAYSRYSWSSDIFVMNSDGTDTQRLTRTGRVDEFEPEWSPDGKKIAFTSYRFNFVEMGDAEEGKAFEPATIESEAAASEEAVEEEEEVEVSVMNADGTDRKDLTRSPAYDTSPAFSPNGTRIAFTRGTFSRRSEESDIFVMQADGTRVRQVTDTSRAFEWGPDWQPLVP
jgi:TolB protein